MGEHYIRLEHHEVGLLLIEDVVLVGGGALATLYGGTFYVDRIAPTKTPCIMRPRI